MAKNDHVPSPASSPSKASSAAAKKAAVPKVKANTKSKVTKDDMQALKKRKANNSGLAVANIDSDEGSLTEGEAAANQTNSHSRAINEVETTEPSLANKRKIDEMLVFHEDKDSHNGIKVEEPFNFDGDLSNSESSIPSIFASIACTFIACISIACTFGGLQHVSAASSPKT